MAKASFFANDLKVRKKGEYLIVEARKMCQHGTVFDEIFLTVPAEWAPLFTRIEQTPNSVPSEDQNGQADTITNRFKRFLTDN